MKKDILPRTQRPSWFHPAFGLAAVLVALPAAVHAQEQAKQADSFVDSIGINIKLNYTDTPYGNFPMVEQVLQQAGIRHVRGGVDPNSSNGTGQQEIAGLNKLYTDYGIKTDAIFAPIENPNNLSASQLILAQIGAVSSCIEDVEGPNETDGFDGNGHQFSYNGVPFPQSTIDYQNVLWATLKGSPQYAYLPIIAPSMSNPVYSPRIAGMEYVSDYGNTHSYNGSIEPDTTTATYSGMPAAYPVLYNFYLPYLAQEMENSTKPIMATETGNWVGTDADWASTGDWRAPITAASQGKYALRTLADYYTEGITRTYLHELVDEHIPGQDYYNVVESHFGILYNDWTPKPAYTGIKNLIATLADPGPAFTPGALTYTLSGSTTNVRHILLQKRDGSFDLILWQAVRSYNNNRGSLGDIAIPTEAVTVSFGTNVGQVAVIDPTVSATPASKSSNITSTTVNVPDNLLILHITPQAAVVSGTPITGTLISDTYGPWNKVAANGPKAAIDGSVSTFYDCASASNGYVGIDAGKPVSVGQIAYAPRSGFASRMLSNTFEGSTDNKTWTTLATVTKTPTAGLTNTLPVTTPGTFRYLRYHDTHNGDCNVAEIQFQR